jgi:hypothetical protein
MSATGDDWVLWAACGCPEGVCCASSYPSEMDAWSAFYDTFAEAQEARQAGKRMELITHDRWCSEVMERFGKCEHAATEVGQLELFAAGGGG